mgnify:CR=1 FL=1
MDHFQVNAWEWSFAYLENMYIYEKEKRKIITHKNVKEWTLNAKVTARTY